MGSDSLPLLQHALNSPSAFTPERLMDAVRVERGLTQEALPPLWILDFDTSGGSEVQGVAVAWSSTL